MLVRPTRSQRRAASRDDARAHLIHPKPASYGRVAEIVHVQHRLPIARISTSSGQRRVNAKRLARAEFWRTVVVQVWPEMEGYFREHLHDLGDGARIVSRTVPTTTRVIDLHVHIPGAPPNAVTAEPEWYVDHRHEQPRPYLDHINWYDAAGHCVEDAEQLAEVAL